MSILIASDGDQIAHANVTNASAATMWSWIYPTDDTARQAVMYYQGTGEYGVNWRADLAGDNFIAFKVRATTPVDATVAAASFGVYALNKWLFLVFRFDAASATSTEQQLWMGDLTTRAAEPSGYVSQSAGSGAATNTAGTVTYGNGPVTTREFKGRIACGGIINRALTPSEIYTLQFNTRKVADTELLAYYWSTGLALDYSGNNRHGTVTGGTTAAHAPLRPPFGNVGGWRGNFTAAAPPAGGFRNFYPGFEGSPFYGEAA